MRKLIKLMLLPLLILGFAGISFAAPSIQQYITPSNSVARGGVISNSGTVCNGQTNESIALVGTQQIKGVIVGSTGTAQCVYLQDATNCGVFSGASSVFESCSPANTSTYFDFSNSPIRVVNGVIVGSSRTDGFAIVYTP